jgi:hypothetical protein
MKTYLEDMDVKEIWYLVSADDRLDGDAVVGGRGRVVARRLREWAAHPFWAEL